MDINEALAELRRMVQEDENLPGEWSAEVGNQRCARYSELVSAIDEWLTGGGFLPVAWVRREPA